jgi:hypothetical protein
MERTTVCMSSSTPKYTSTSTVQAPTQAPTVASEEVTAARDDEKRRGLSAKGLASTILTGAQGVTEPAAVQRKTLLGA